MAFLDSDGCWSKQFPVGPFLETLFGADDFRCYVCTSPDPDKNLAFTASASRRAPVPSGQSAGRGQRSRPPCYLGELSGSGDENTMTTDRERLDGASDCTLAPQVPAVGGPFPDDEAAPALDPSPEMVRALLPYLEESVMVVRDEWEVAANLTPPRGLTGRPRGVGSHAMTFLHPDDALRLFEWGMAAFRAEPGWSGVTTARVQQPDGSFKQFDLTIHNRRDHPVINGLVVSSRRSHREADQASDGIGQGIRAETLAELLPIGVAVLSPLGTTLFANAVAAELLGSEVEDLCAGLLTDVVAPEDRSRLSAIIADLAARPGRERLRLAPGDEGRLIELKLVSHEDGGPAETALVIATVQDLTHRLAREQQLVHRANHDPLTGLANRAWLLDHLHERLVTGEPMTVAYVDLDRFKSVNDRLGHLAGDAVLAAVATGLDGCLHPGEVAARVGGDEFVIVSGVLDDNQLADFSQRIHLAVATVPAARRQRVGVSVGLARSSPDDEPWGLLRRADAAMYGEKRRVDRRSGSAGADLASKALSYPSRQVTPAPLPSDPS